MQIQADIVLKQGQRDHILETNRSSTLCIGYSCSLHHAFRLFQEKELEEYFSHLVRGSRSDPLTWNPKTKHMINLSIFTLLIWMRFGFLLWLLSLGSIKEFSSNQQDFYVFRCFKHCGKKSSEADYSIKERAICKYGIWLCILPAGPAPKTPSCKFWIYSASRATSGEERKLVGLYSTSRFSPLGLLPRREREQREVPNPNPGLTVLPTLFKAL